MPSAAWLYVRMDAASASCGSARSTRRAGAAAGVTSAVLFATVGPRYSTGGTEVIGLSVTMGAIVAACAAIVNAAAPDARAPRSRVGV